MAFFDALWDEALRAKTLYLLGLIALAIEVWAVRRRLESVIQLISLRSNEQA